ncbi:four helix bundle protein [bacterium]|nr:four helix bundle protein [bacterium]
MSQDPPVISDAYQLSLSLFHRTKGFTKHLRPTLGRRLEEASLELLVLLRNFSFSKDKIQRKQTLALCSQRLDEIRLLTQLSFDLKALTPASYQEVAEFSSCVGKQIGGLLKSVR